MTTVLPPRYRQPYILAPPQIPSAPAEAAYTGLMRNFVDMPKKLHGENLRAIPTKEVDKAVLRKFAEPAQYLGFESPDITTLKEYPHSTTAAATHTLSKPVLVTGGRREMETQASPPADL